MKKHVLRIGVTKTETKNEPPNKWKSIEADGFQILKNKSKLYFGLHLYNAVNIQLHVDIIDE